MQLLAKSYTTKAPIVGILRRPRCRSGTEDPTEGVEHKQCSCGEHCGCNPCTCSKAVVAGICKCGAGCTCVTCAA
ncbi:hypothetical protein LguiA_027725 [Lonicera macranthoides]